MGNTRPMGRNVQVTDYLFKTKPYQHQKERFYLYRDKPYHAHLWEQGCVDCQTEYLAPDGWHRIDQYKSGPVAQWNPETGKAEFVEPLEYIVGECTSMLHFKGRGVDQMLTGLHRMPTLTKHNKLLGVRTAGEVAEQLWGSKWSLQRIPSNVSMPLFGTGIDLSENGLRLQVAVNADGSFPNACKRTKTFPLSWWQEVTNEQRDIILDEVFHWDGSLRTDNRGPAYYSRHESDTDFIQFLLTSAGKISSKAYSGGVWAVSVRGSRTNGYWLRGDNVTHKEPSDGKKYCFKVPSTFLVLRRNGCVFPTGNTGKSKIIIDSGAYLYAQGAIDAIMIIAPNGVHRNWVINEIPKHCPDYIDYKYAYYASSLNKSEKEKLNSVLKYKGLKLISMNVEALATKKGKEFLNNFLECFRSMLLVDESTSIKNPKAARTKTLLKMKNKAYFRRILTGTPVTQGPLDLFTQFNFLDDDILRTSSYYAFRNRYCIMKEMRHNGRSFQVVDSYCNLDELQELIAPYSDRLLKVDCLDLPEKVYQKHYVNLSDAQLKVYKELKKDMVAEIEGQFISTQLALTKLLRLQQIIGGFIQFDQTIEFDEDMHPIIHAKEAPKPIDKVNPRIEALAGLVEETQGKVIIWARFRAEIEAICARLRALYPHGVVEYHGGIPNDERARNIELFQEDQNIKVFVANKAAWYGLTLTAASTVIYYSNEYSLEGRLQSEDRAHRIGQRNNVNYIDIIAPDTVDEHIVTALRSKKDISNIITGDEELSNWLK